MKRYMLTFGALAGGVILVYSLVLFAVMGDFATMTVKDLQLVETLGYVRYLILLLGVAMGMLAYRRRTPGPISYSSILRVGIGVAAVTALLVGAFEAAYVAANPDFFEHFARLSEQALRATNPTQADLKAFHQKQQDFAFMANPLAMGAFYFIETLLMGSAFALVGAIFGRRNDEGTSSSPQVMNQTA